MIPTIQQAVKLALNSLQVQKISGPFILSFYTVRFKNTNTITVSAVLIIAADY